jgi:hypothetical protein
MGPGNIGEMASLAAQLRTAASAANRAAADVAGAPLPTLPRSFEVQRAYRSAGRAAAMLERLEPSIARMPSGDDAVRLARDAIEFLGNGQRAMRDGISMTDDVLRNGDVVADAVSTGTATAWFREAEGKVRGLADLAQLEATPIDDLMRSITGRQ